MHNLIVKNDETSDYVQFTVNIPDGYNKFTVDDLNGSIINQNYLKVGDTITFKFSNNPMEYDISGIPLNIITRTNNIGEQTSLTMQEDTETYNKLKLNLNHYYRLVFIPVYLYYDVNRSALRYVFNPCEDNQIFLEPKSIIPTYYLDDVNHRVELPFTGKYIMALQETVGNVIPDIKLTIGESINNSKMRSTDAGSFQITTNTVNEVNVNQISRQSYDYGNVWAYPVDNLIMKHKETVIVYGSNVTVSKQILSVIKVDHGQGSYSYSKVNQLITELGQQVS